MGPDQIEAIRLSMMLGLSAYSVLALWVLRSWAAGLYARAVARALAGPEADMWRTTALGHGDVGGKRPWKLTHWLRIVVLSVIWFGFSAQIFVAQFLNHDWHLWVTHPLLILPWIG